jgi:flagellar biosynthesis protein FlhA
MGAETSSQLLSNPKPLYLAAGVLGFLGILPGMPHFAFLPLALVAAGAAYLASQRVKELATQKESETADERIAEAAKTPERIESLLKVDALSLEVGYGLVGLVTSDDSFLSRIREIRKQTAIELGIIVPSIHVKDNLQLAPREYAVLLKGEKIAGGEIHPDGYLAIDPGFVREKISGIDTTDPAFGMPATWLRRAEDRDRAMTAGYTVVDSTTVICTHLAELIKRHAHELLGRQETRALLDSLSETHPKTVEEATPKVLALGEVQRVLQGLLRERVPIRDLATILESITDVGVVTRDVNALTEAARAALSRTISASLSSESGELSVLTLDPHLETQLAERLGLLGGASHQAIEPEFGKQLLEKIETATRAAVMSQPVVLCSAMVRPHLRKLTERFLPDLSVIAHGEIGSNVRLVSLGTVS